MAVRLKGDAGLVTTNARDGRIEWFDIKDAPWPHRDPQSNPRFRPALASPVRIVMRPRAQLRQAPRDEQ